MLLTQSGHRLEKCGSEEDFTPYQALASTSTILLEPGANMMRREFLAGVTGALAMPLSARAQQTTTRTIGWFSLRSANSRLRENHSRCIPPGIGQTGYVEGRNLTIEYSFADGQYDRLPLLAADLVRRQVEVLMTTGGTNIARVAQAATTTTPVIFATASDPVQDGLVKSINRPGGNSTGAYVFNTALLPKRFELLRQLLPNARLVGFLVNPNGATTPDQFGTLNPPGETWRSSFSSSTPRHRPKSMAPSAVLCSMALTDW